MSVERRPRTACSRRTHSGSALGVMTAMARRGSLRMRSHASVWVSGVRPSAWHTARKSRMRRSCRTARCGSSTVPRESFAINPTLRPRLCTCAAMDAARLRRVVSPRAERLRAPHLLRARSHQVGHRPHARIDEDRRALRELQLAVEQAERFPYTQRCRTERHPATPAIHAPRPPPDGLAAERDDTAGLVVSDLAEVADLDPGRGNPALAPNLELLLVDLADGRRAGVDAARDRDAANRQP